MFDVNKLKLKYNISIICRFFVDTILNYSTLYYKNILNIFNFLLIVNWNLTPQDKNLLFKSKLFNRNLYVSISI